MGPAGFPNLRPLGYKLGIAMRRDDLAPMAALALLAVALAIIPYGAPVATLYQWCVLGLGTAMIAITYADPKQRWRRVSIWPMLAILAAWGIAIYDCPRPMTSLERSYGMGLYSLCFIAVQVVAWNPRLLRALMWVVLAAVLACITDVLAQWAIGSSLFTGQPKRHAGFHGSQGNQNDLACVSVLLPLTSAVLPGAAGLALYVAMLAITSPVWILSKSRQIMLGWCIGALPPLAPRVPRKWLLIAAVGVLGLIALAVTAFPELRARVAQTASAGLGERGPVFGFGLTLFASHWIDGAGPGLFGNFYMSALKAKWTWMGQRLPPIGMPWVHSLPIEVLCETGVIGSLAMLASLAEAVRRLFRAWRSAATNRTILVAVITAAGCMAAIGLIDLSFIKDWVRVCFWLILGLCYAMSPRERQLPDPDVSSAPEVPDPDGAAARRC